MANNHKYNSTREMNSLLILWAAVIMTFSCQNQLRTILSFDKCLMQKITNFNPNSAIKQKKPPSDWRERKLAEKMKTIVKSKKKWENESEKMIDFENVGTPELKILRNKNETKNRRKIQENKNQRNLKEAKTKKLDSVDLSAEQLERNLGKEKSSRKEKSKKNNNKKKSRKSKKSKESKIYDTEMVSDVRNQYTNAPKYQPDPNNKYISTENVQYYKIEKDTVVWQDSEDPKIFYAVIYFPDNFTLRKSKAKNKNINEIHRENNNEKVKEKFGETDRIFQFSKRTFYLFSNAKNSIFKNQSSSSSKKELKIPNQVLSEMKMIFLKNHKLDANCQSILDSEKNFLFVLDSYSNRKNKKERYKDSFKKKNFANFNFKNRNILFTFRNLPSSFDYLYGDLMIGEKIIRTPQLKTKIQKEKIIKDLPYENLLFEYQPEPRFRISREGKSSKYQRQFSLFLRNKPEKNNSRQNNYFFSQFFEKTKKTEKFISEKWGYEFDQKYRLRSYFGWNKNFLSPEIDKILKLFQKQRILSENNEANQKTLRNVFLEFQSNFYRGKLEFPMIYSSKENGTVLQYLKNHRNSKNEKKFENFWEHMKFFFEENEQPDHSSENSEEDDNSNLNLRRNFKKSEIEDSDSLLSFEEEEKEELIHNPVLKNVFIARTVPYIEKFLLQTLPIEINRFNGVLDNEILGHCMPFRNPDNKENNFQKSSEIENKKKELCSNFFEVLDYLTNNILQIFSKKILTSFGRDKKLRLTTMNTVMKGFLRILKRYLKKKDMADWFGIYILARKEEIKRNSINKNMEPDVEWLTEVFMGLILDTIVLPPPRNFIIIDNKGEEIKKYNYQREDATIENREDMHVDINWDLGVVKDFDDLMGEVFDYFSGAINSLENSILPEEENSYYLEKLETIAREWDVITKKKNSNTRENGFSGWHKFLNMFSSQKPYKNQLNLKYFKLEFSKILYPFFFSLIETNFKGKIKEFVKSLTILESDIGKIENLKTYFENNNRMKLFEALEELLLPNLRNGIETRVSKSDQGCPALSIATEIDEKILFTEQTMNLRLWGLNNKNLKHSISQQYLDYINHLEIPIKIKQDRYFTFDFGLLKCNLKNGEVNLRNSENFLRIWNDLRNFFLYGLKSQTVDYFDGIEGALNFKNFFKIFYPNYWYPNLDKRISEGILLSPRFFFYLYNDFADHIWEERITRLKSEINNFSSNNKNLEKDVNDFIKDIQIKNNAISQKEALEIIKYENKNLYNKYLIFNEAKEMVKRWNNQSSKRNDKEIEFVQKDNKSENNLQTKTKSQKRVRKGKNFGDLEKIRDNQNNWIEEEEEETEEEKRERQKEIDRIFNVIKPPKNDPEVRERMLRIVHKLRIINPTWSFSKISLYLQLKNALFLMKDLIRNHQNISTSNLNEL